MHSENEGARGTNAPRQLSGHGLAYWTDGKEERILYVTPGYRLIALDAKTGIPIPGFGKDGVVDLKQDDDQEIDLVNGDIGLHSTPVVAKQRSDRRGRAPDGRSAKKQEKRERLRSRIRRADGQAPLDFPYHPASRRVRNRYLGEGFLVRIPEIRASGVRSRSMKN